VGSKKKEKSLAAMLLVPRKSGCPLGSRNKKTLVAPVAAAARVSTEAATAATAFGNSSDAVTGMAL
jgi:hypothetical protein